MQNSKDDRLMQQKFQILQQRLQDPNRWGEGPYTDETEIDPVTEWWNNSMGIVPQPLPEEEIVTEEDVISIWEWAVDRGDRRTQATIAALVVGGLSLRDHGRSDKRLRQEIMSLVNETRNSEHLEIYVGFLEALISLEYDSSRRLAMHNEARTIYARSGNWGREIWHMDQEAYTLMHLRRWNEASQLFMSIYGISRKVNYKKGVGLALLGFGNLLETQRRHLDACRFLYAAKQILDNIPSVFAITAKDTLGSIRDLNNIPKDQYQTKEPVEALVNWFQTNINL